MEYREMFVVVKGYENEIQGVYGELIYAVEHLTQLVAEERHGCAILTYLVNGKRAAIEHGFRIFTLRVEDAGDVVYKREESYETEINGEQPYCTVAFGKDARYHSVFARNEPEALAKTAFIIGQTLGLR